MTWPEFLKKLTWLTILVFLLSLMVSQFGDFRLTIIIYTFAIISFVVFSLIIFLYAYNTSSSDNLFSFNNVVVASFLIKLILSIGVIMLYEKFYNPKTDYHILHYIIVYVLYTGFEVYFLTKLAKFVE